MEPGEAVEGILYSVADECLDSLNAREGAPTDYRPILVTVEFQGEFIKNVLSYSVVNKSEREYRPSDVYANLMLKGGRELSPSYLEKLQGAERRWNFWR